MLLFSLRFLVFAPTLWTSINGFDLASVFEKREAFSKDVQRFFGVYGENYLDTGTDTKPNDTNRENATVTGSDPTSAENSTAESETPENETVTTAATEETSPDVTEATSMSTTLDSGTTLGRTISPIPPEETTANSTTGCTKQCDENEVCFKDGDGEEKCRCRPGYTEVGDTCLECQCDENEDCSINQITQEKNCTCKDGFQKVNGVCTEIDSTTAKRSTLEATTTVKHSTSEPTTQETKVSTTDDDVKTPAETTTDSTTGCTKSCGENEVCFKYENGEEKCRCRSGYAYMGEVCLECECGENEDCSLDQVTQEKNCTCKDGFQRVDTECRTGNTTVITSTAAVSSATVSLTTGKTMDETTESTQFSSEPSPTASQAASTRTSFATASKDSGSETSETNDAKGTSDASQRPTPAKTSETVDGLVTKETDSSPPTTDDHVASERRGSDPVVYGSITAAVSVLVIGVILIVLAKKAKIPRKLHERLYQTSSSAPSEAGSESNLSSENHAAGVV